MSLRCLFNSSDPGAGAQGGGRGSRASDTGSQAAGPVRRGSNGRPGSGQGVGMGVAIRGCWGQPITAKALGGSTAGLVPGLSSRQGCLGINGPALLLSWGTGHKQGSL